MRSNGGGVCVSVCGICRKSKIQKYICKKIKKPFGSTETIKQRKLFFYSENVKIEGFESIRTFLLHVSLSGK